MRTYSDPTVNSEPTVLNRKEKQRSREYRETEKLVVRLFKNFVSRNVEL